MLVLSLALLWTGEDARPPPRAVAKRNIDVIVEFSVLQFCHMGNTLTIRLPQEILEKLKETSRRTGVPVGRLVRQSLENTLSRDGSSPLLEFAGLIKGGPKNLSSRKGFSRG